MKLSSAIIVLIGYLACEAAQITQLSGSQMVISDLTAAAGYGCKTVQGKCNACEMIVNFEFADDGYGPGSFKCKDERAGVIGRCLTCILPGSEKGRLLNIDGTANCEQEIANYIIDNNIALFTNLWGFSEQKCANSSLNSDHNLNLANGIVEVFKDPVNNTAVEEPVGLPPPRNLKLIIGLCAAAVVLLVVLIVIVLIYMRKK